jgi:hypothetical protein
MQKPSLAKLKWPKETIKPEDSLTFAGLETCDQDRAAALAIQQAEELTAEMRRPLKDISRQAGEMERNAPLFYGQINPTLF